MKKIIILLILLSLYMNNYAVYADEIQEVNFKEQKQEVLSSKTKQKYQNLCKDAEKFYQEKNYQKAKIVIEKAIALAPSLDEAYALQSNILLDNNKLEEAKVLAEKALNINPNNYKANYSIAFYYDEKDKNYIKAIGYYDKVLNVNHNHYASLIRKLWIYNNYFKNYNQVIELATSAISVNPKSAHIYFERSFAYKNKEQYKEALADINNAISLDPKNIKYQAEKAIIYADMNDAASALKMINPLIKKYPNNIELYLKRLYIYSHINASKTLIMKDLQLCEKFVNNDEDSLNNLISYYLKFDNYDKVIELSERIIALNPNNTKALTSYIIAELHFQNYSKALELLNNIPSEYRSQFPNYDFSMANVKLGLAGYDNKELINEAINYLNKSIEKNKNNHLSYGLRGLAYLFLGNYKDAYKDFVKSDKIKSNYYYILNILITKDIATYNNARVLNGGVRVWGVPEYMNEDEYDNTTWDKLADLKPNDVVVRINQSNSGYERNNDFIYSTIKLIKQRNCGIGKVYSLHMDDKHYGNTTKIVVSPYIDATYNIAQQISNDDYNLVLANQYYLLLRNYAYSMDGKNNINEEDINNFFDSLVDISEKDAFNMIMDLYKAFNYTDKELAYHFYIGLVNYIKMNLNSNLKNEYRQILKDSYLKMAEILMDDGNINKAIELYEEAIKYGYSKFDVYKSIALSYMDYNNHFKIIEYATKALSIKADGQLYACRGLARYKLKDYSSAILDLTKAVSYKEYAKIAYSLRADIYFEQERYQLAYSDYLKASTYEKTNPSYIYNAGICLYNQGKKLEAIKFLEQAKNISQKQGNSDMYRECVKLINKIKGY